MSTDKNIDAEALEASKYNMHGALRTLTDKIVEWRERKGFKTSWLNTPEKLMLIVSEVSEAMEEYRDLSEEYLYALQHKNGSIAAPLFEADNDEFYARADKAQETSQRFAAELADAVIRILDLAGSLHLDIETAIVEKMERNERRPNKHGRVR